MSVGSLKAFQDITDPSFLIKLEGHEDVTLELNEVEVNALAPAGYESFSLFFLGNPDRLLDQGMFRFVHDELGELSIFLSPKGVDQEKAIYEAVFNQAIE